MSMPRPHHLLERLCLNTRRHTELVLYSRMHIAIMGRLVQLVCMLDKEQKTHFARWKWCRKVEGLYRNLADRGRYVNVKDVSMKGPVIDELNPTLSFFLAVDNYHASEGWKLRPTLWVLHSGLSTYISREVSIQKALSALRCTIQLHVYKCTSIHHN